MPLTCSALAPFSDKLSCETGSFFQRRNPHNILQLEVLRLQFPIRPSPPGLCGLPPCHWSSPPGRPSLPPPTGLFECFFNFLVVGFLCSLIFWHFWLFIVFKLVVILVFVVQGSEAFLPTPPSWQEPSGYTFLNVNQAPFSFLRESLVYLHSFVWEAVCLN